MRVRGCRLPREERNGPFSLPTAAPMIADATAREQHGVWRTQGVGRERNTAFGFHKPPRGRLRFPSGNPSVAAARAEPASAAGVLPAGGQGRRVAWGVMWVTACL